VTGCVVILVWLQVLGDRLCCDTGVVTGTWRQVAQNHRDICKDGRRNSTTCVSSQRRSSLCGCTNTARVPKLLKKVSERVLISGLSFGPQRSLTSE
jgi:hypothetical protein